VLGSKKKVADCSLYQSFKLQIIRLITIFSHPENQQQNCDVIHECPFMTLFIFSGRQLMCRNARLKISNQEKVTIIFEDFDSPLLKFVEKLMAHPVEKVCQK
jgi:hypothetical protein